MRVAAFLSLLGILAYFVVAFSMSSVAGGEGTTQGPHLVFGSPTIDGATVRVDALSQESASTDAWAGYQLQIAWNPHVLSLQSVSQAGTVFAPFETCGDPVIDNAAGSLEFACATSGSARTPGGLLATLAFQAVASGCSPLEYISTVPPALGLWGTAHTMDATTYEIQDNTYQNTFVGSDGLACSVPSTPVPSPTGTPTPIYQEPTATSTPDPLVTPTPADYDLDGVLDEQDNCPGYSNAAPQANTDNAPLIVGGFPPDTTIAASDLAGDACDGDDDNDYMVDADELAIPSEACPSATTATDPTKRDTDGDRFLDGAECRLGTDPGLAASKPTLFPTNQCAAYLGVSISSDTDGDRIKDYVEFCYYGSDPNDNDTDDDRLVDGATDGCEAASFNGDRIVNVADMGMLATGISHTVAYHVNIDVNKDGVLNPADQGIVASFISPAGQCP